MFKKISFFFVFLVGISSVFQNSWGRNYRFSAMWPGLLPEPWYFNSPNGIAADSSGNVYIADTGNHCIQKFTSSGVFITKWGNKGSEDGQFNLPSAIVVDSSGNVYVADTGNHRIQKFTSSGAFIARWGTPGTGEGQFISPQGIALDSLGNIFVADTNNHRIQMFLPNGYFVEKWGIQGIENGQFKSPSSIAIDTSDNVYVVDTYNFRIQKFTASGDFIAKWGISGMGDGQFSSPKGIAVDSFDNVYVADTGNYRIQKFDSAGTFITKWGRWGRGNGQFTGAEGIMADLFGNIYVTDGATSRIQKFNSTGTFMGKWASSGNEFGQFSLPNAVTLDTSGNVYVSDYYNYRVQKQTSSGEFIAKLGGTWGNGILQSYYTTAVATDNLDNVYVADEWTAVSYSFIRKYTSSGTLITRWGSWGTGDGQFRSIGGLAVDASNNVYVTDTLNNRIQKFDSSGAFITKWGSWGMGNGQFIAPHGIAVDISGNVYVTDRTNNCIQKFTSSGDFILKWGSYGSEDGQFNAPYGVAVDSSGFVYVTDSGNNRIQKFTSSGTFFAKWGSEGSEEGQLNSPRGITADSIGNIYVADTFNNRVQKFQRFAFNKIEGSESPYYVVISWESDPQEIYTAYYSDDPWNENSWNLIQDNIPAFGRETSLKTPTPPLDKLSRYFKIVIRGRTAPNYDLRFGVFSDSHYDRNDDEGADIYSLNKINSAIEVFNSFPVDFMIGLGDIIDSKTSFTDDVVNLFTIDTALNNFTAGDAYICIGNHDQEWIPGQYIANYSSHVPNTPYYTFTVKGVKCIVLQCGDIPWALQHTHLSGDIDDTVTTIPVVDNSFFVDPKVIRIEDELITYTERTGTSFSGCLRGAYATTKSSHLSDAHVTYYNGYTKISQTQVNWLASELATPEPKLIFVHPRLSVGFPTDPTTPIVDLHCENADIIRPVIEAGVNVLAVFEGHQHTNKYSLVNGIRYYEITGLLWNSDPEDNAFGIVQIDTASKAISIIGFGRQSSYGVTYPR